MKCFRIYLKLLTTFSFFCVLIFSPRFSLATPSADSLLSACGQTLQNTSLQTQHLIYQTTLIMAQGTQAPVTNVQTIEVYKKAPNLMKMITNNGYSTQTVISNGTY